MMEEAASPLPHLAHPPFPALTVMVDADDFNDPVVEAAAEEQVLNTSLRAFKCRGRGGAVDRPADEDVPDAAVCRITTVLTLLDPALGVGLSRPPPPPPPPSPSSLLSLEEVVDPELTPLELCKTRLLWWWWMFRVEPRLLLRHPDLMLPVPVRRLAVSRQRLEARIDALTLCLLPSRTATKTRNRNV